MSPPRGPRRPPGHLGVLCPPDTPKGRPPPRPPTGTSLLRFTCLCCFLTCFWYQKKEKRAPRISLTGGSQLTLQQSGKFPGFFPNNCYTVEWIHRDFFSRSTQILYYVPLWWKISLRICPTVQGQLTLRQIEMPSVSIVKIQP